MALRGASLLLVALACGACSVGPKYRRPAVTAPAAFKEQPPKESDQWKAAHPNDGELRGNWWEMFGDARLNELEPKVAASNQNVKQAEAQFAQARALVSLNRANYYPVIGTSPSITTSESPSRGGVINSSGGVASNRSGTATVFNLPFQASWEPDLWGRVRLSVENAVTSAQASAAQIENMRLSMQAELAADYFLLRATDMEIALYSTTISDYERALRLTINRFNGGVASKADVLQAQTQLSSARAQSTDLLVSRAQYEHAIAVLTGQAPAALAIDPGGIQGAPPPVPSALPSHLLERRPDIATAERRVAAANAEIGLAQTAYYPTLTLGVTGGLSATNVVDWFSWPSRLWSVGPALSQTLFDFGRRRAQVQETEAFYDSQVAAYRQTVLGAFQEVEDNLAALRILEAEAAQQQETVTSAQQAVQLELERYKAGTVSFLDVITTQTITLINQRAAVAILRNRMTATVQLVRAMGGGWNASTLPSANDLRTGASADPSKVAQPPRP